jgi:hypothetical protein
MAYKNTFQVCQDIVDIFFKTSPKPTHKLACRAFSDIQQDIPTRNLDQR